MCHIRVAAEKLRGAGGRGESALELHQIRSQDEAGDEVMRRCNRSR